MPGTVFHSAGNLGLAARPETRPASRVCGAVGTTMSVLSLFVSSAGMVASALFFSLCLLTRGSLQCLLVGAGSLIVAASVYALAVRSFALPGRSRSPALVRTRIVSLGRAQLPPVVCGLAVPVTLALSPIGWLLIPIVLLGFIGWAHHARRRIADDVCALRGWSNVRRVREVVLLLETSLILGTIPLLGLTLSFLQSLGYGFGGLGS